MSTVAYPVQQDSSGKGCTAPTLRQIVKARWNNKGVVTGLGVTGGTSLVYNVSAGVAVCSKGSADGYTEAYYDGGATEAVAAGDASNPRIDTIWITSHDITLGDTDNSVVIGVTSGTPASSPAKPTIPTYATEIASMLVPSGASSTSGTTEASPIPYAIPYGASLGVLVDSTDTSGGTFSTPRTSCSGSFFIPSDRVVDVFVTETCSANGGVWANGEGSVYINLLLDGENKRSFECRAYSVFAGSMCFHDSWVIPAGSHTVSLVIKKGGLTSWTQYYSPSNWAGQRLQIVDRGVA